MAQNDDNRRLALANALKDAVVKKAAPASTVSDVGLAHQFAKRFTTTHNNLLNMLICYAFNMEVSSVI